MFKSHKAAGDSQARLPRRHKLAIGVSAVGGALAALTMAAPAGAVSPPTNVNYPAAAANNLIVGSGSSTDYQMMHRPGLPVQPGPWLRHHLGLGVGRTLQGQPAAELRCESNAAAPRSSRYPATTYLDNPINDVATEAASDGLVQRHRPAGRRTATTGHRHRHCVQPRPPENVSAINYARSSRDPSGANDIQGPELRGLRQGRRRSADLVRGEQRQGAFASDPDQQARSDQSQLKASTTAPSTTGPSSVPRRALRSSSTRPKRARGPRRPSRRSWVPSTPRPSTNQVNCTDPVPRGRRSTTTANLNADLEQAAGTHVGSVDAHAAACKGPDVIFENEDASILRNASHPARCLGRQREQAARPHHRQRAARW